MCVVNMRLNLRASVSWAAPQSGHLWAFMFSSGIWSARNRCLQFLQSMSGSVKFSTCPEASHTRGCIMMAASSPTMFEFSCVICRHQNSWMRFFSSTPMGP